MAIDLSELDHEKLDAFFRQVLDWHLSGEVGTEDAIGALAHVFAAAAIDNKSEVLSWLHKPETLRQWKSDIG